MWLAVSRNDEADYVQADQHRLRFFAARPVDTVNTVDPYLMCRACLEQSMGFRPLNPGVGGEANPFTVVGIG